MKIQGKSIFTIESINNNKPELKIEVKDAVDWIIKCMKDNGIDKVEL